MRILITGGAGLVGSHAAEFYARGKNEVIVLDNLMRSKLFQSGKESVEYNWNYLKQYENIKLMKGDVRKRTDVEEAIGDGVDALIHTAGQPGVGLSVRDPREDFSINAFGTFNVLECLRERAPGAAFVYTSTNKVYGENVDSIPLEEDASRYRYVGRDGVSEAMSVDLTGHTPYGASKYVGDIYTQEYGRIYGMRTACFRMSCIYGTRQFGFEDQGWVAWFVIAALTGQPVTIYGDGKQVRDVLWVDDLVNAFDSYIRGDLGHRVFNIGGGPENTMSLLEFLDILGEELGAGLEVSFSDWRPSDQKVYISDTGRVRGELGWKPHIGPREGVRLLIDWARQNRSLF